MSLCYIEKVILYKKANKIMPNDKPNLVIFVRNIIFK